MSSLNYLSRFYKRHSETVNDFSAQEVCDMVSKKIIDSYKNYPVYYKTNSCFGTIIVKRKNIYSSVKTLISSYNDNDIFNHENIQEEFIKGYERIY